MIHRIMLPSRPQTQLARVGIAGTVADHARARMDLKLTSETG
jgi:hypothetical protein